MGVRRIGYEMLPVMLRKHLEFKRREFVTEARRMAAFGAEKARAFAVAEDLVAFGDYSEGFKSKGTPDGAVIYNDVPYADVVEFGRAPGAPPPFAKIRAWVNVKFMIYGKAAHPIAESVRMAIARRGLPPKRILHQATQWTLVRLRGAYVNALKRAP